MFISGGSHGLPLFFFFFYAEYVNETRKIIIDCDPGNGIPGANVDDAIALAYAVRQPAFDVRAIWTVFGNTSATEGRAAAEALLASLGTFVLVGYVFLVLLPILWVVLRVLATIDAAAGKKVRYPLTVRLVR